MAVFAHAETGARTVARKVTGTNVTDVSQWLHSLGFVLFAVAEEMAGFVIVADGDSPRAVTVAEFAAEFVVPEHLVDEYGVPGD